MKNQLTTAGATVFLCAFILTNPAGAIPSQFGGIGFINPAGMRLEDFAALPKTWEPGARLPGSWEMWHDDAVSDNGIELLRLKLSALVFGIQATNVIVHRRNMQIEKIQIYFAPDRKTGDLPKLEKLLQANAAIWSDAKEVSRSVEAGSAKYVIESDVDGNRSIITITKLKGVAATADLSR